MSIWDHTEHPTGQPLTPEEVEALDDGTPIVVQWSGGNGPWRYTARRQGRWLVAQSEDEARRGVFDGVGKMLNGPDSFVGVEPMHTRVWLSPTAAEGTP